MCIRDRIVGVLRSHYNVLPSAEITFECNPGDVGKLDIEHLLSYGINRFSIGAQSFHDRLLQKLGRRHNHQEIIGLFESLRQAGVSNKMCIRDRYQNVLDLQALYRTHVLSLYPKGSSF